MLTTIGKALVFFTTLLSVAGLAFAIWAVTDPTENYTAREREIRADIGKYDQIKTNEIAAIFMMVSELEKTKVRTVLGIPGLDKPKSVGELEKENDQFINDSKSLLADVQQLQQAYSTVVNEIEDLRKKLYTEKDLAKQLRLKIEPDAAMKQAGSLSFRDQIDQAQTDKLESEKRAEGLKPPLYETGIYLQFIQERAAELMSKEQAYSRPNR